MFLKNTGIIVALLIVAAIAFYFYRQWAGAVDGITPMSGLESGNAGSATAAILALAASIISLAGSIMGVLMKYMEFKSKQLDIMKKERDLNGE